MVFDQLCVNIRLLLTKVNIELNVNVDMNIGEGRICRIHYNLTDDCRIHYNLTDDKEL